MGVRIYSHKSPGGRRADDAECDAIVQRSGEYDWVLDGRKHRVHRANVRGREAVLTPGEYELLALLIRSPGQIIRLAAKNKKPSGVLRTFQNARKKLEGEEPWSITIADEGDVKRTAVFEPAARKTYCFIEPDAPPVTIAVSARPTTETNPVAAIFANPVPVSLPQDAAVSPPAVQVIGGEASGVVIKIRSWSFRRSLLAVDLAIYNRSGRGRCVERVELRLAGAAYAARQPAARSRSGFLDAWMLSIPAGGVAKGVVLFSRPRDEGNALVVPRVLADAEP